tara:strand:- start:29551 stop:30195 length:645 start_codon:yes stop_codon:yes gene_type:complete
MIKTQDVPRELRTFNSLFNKLCYRHDVSTIFDDFLTLFICCFARGTQEPWYFETIKRYKKEEITTFAHMMGDLIIRYHNAFLANDWIDPLGEYYEILAGNYKKSRLGQFFTPKSICDVMSGLTLQGADWDNKINDCACGSGRLLLSANRTTKDMYHIGQDLDMICAKMAAINLCMHQMKGEIHCMNSITMTAPRKSFLINPKFHEHKTLLIICK